MALFKIEKGLKANLATKRPNTTEGFCYFTTDDGKFYIDTATAIGTSNRVLLNAGAADKLTVNAGAANKPIYFKNGVPTEGSYELNKTVPSNAKFTDTNTKVTQTVTTSNAAYPLLLAPSGQTATTTTTSYFDSGVTLNPSTNTIAANISGDAATATQLYTTQKNPSSGTTYCLPFISSATSGNKDYYANDGIGYWTHEGTTSAVGAGELKLGNSIVSGTAGNKRGMIYMYGTSSGYTEIIPTNDTGSNVIVYLPSKGGTIALDNVFGASGSTAAKGLVPAPSTTAGTTKYLREDGKWVKPPDNNTTYSAGTGISLSGTTFSNSGVRSVATGSSNGTISVNTNGTTANVAVKGLGSAAYTNSNAYAPSSHSHSYLPLSGGTLTGKLQVNAPIFGYNYSSGGNNVASFTWDKPGSNYTGMGACGDADTIYFGACNNDGVWVTDYRQKWKFNGSLIVGGGDDNCNIVPWKNNYSTIGTESLKWWKIYGTTIYGDTVYGAVWNDYAEFRAQTEDIEPGYCVTSADNGQVSKTTEKFQTCDGIVSDTFGFAIGETDECKTPLAVAGRVLAYCEGDRYSYHAGDTVCAGPNGKVMKMTREEICKWPDRIIGTVSEIPEYKTWGENNVEVNGRIWIRVK